MQSAVLAMTDYVCLTVWPSVTRWYHAKKIQLRSWGLHRG